MARDILPLEEHYFTWLYSLVDTVVERNREITRWGLFQLMYTTEFTWLIESDEDRAVDGVTLRFEFQKLADLTIEDESWMSLGCSVFEAMIGLSRRLSFEAGGESFEWFFQLIENLGLAKYTDAKDLPVDDIDQILEELVWRTYQSNGYGGLFPLNHATCDQRLVDIGEQMNFYLAERSGSKGG